MAELLDYRQGWFRYDAIHRFLQEDEKRSSSVQMMINIA
jgi:hypothetical protein